MEKDRASSLTRAALRTAVLSSMHRAPSVGAVVKRLLEVDPTVPPAELMEIVRRSMRPQGEGAGDFAFAEVVDEARALELLRSRRADRAEARRAGD